MHRGDKNNDGERKDDDETKREKAKTSLLNALLSLIFMSPGHTVKEETMDSFLIRLGVLKDHNTVGSDIRYTTLSNSNAFYLVCFFRIVNSFTQLSIL